MSGVEQQAAPQLRGVRFTVLALVIFIAIVVAGFGSSSSRGGGFGGGGFGGGGAGGSW